MSDILMHAVEDSVYMIPFLFAAYIIIEFIERHSSDRMQKVMSGFGKLGPVGGAFLGCVPQCGFSAVAANFYSNRVITLGTLVAVFISTSDEALAVLVSSPHQGGTVLKLIAVKVVIALVTGFLADFIFKSKPDVEKTVVHAKHEHCHGEGDKIGDVFRSAIKHTLSTYILIIIISVILTFAMHELGEEKLSQILMSGTFFQPFAAAAVGFIPNCAASVLLTQLYVEGTLSFGSLVAGLCSSAGVGLVVLFKENKPIRENFKILGVVYAVAIVAGSILGLTLK